MNNDLISREALKKEIIELDLDNTSHWSVIYKINNAPTVEAYPFEQVQELVKLNQQFAQEIENLKRPQGEWKLDGTEQFCYCSNCEDTYYPRPLDPSWYYCPHCGADMRKGGDLSGK